MSWASTSCSTKVGLAVRKPIKAVEPSRLVLAEPFFEPMRLVGIGRQITLGGAATLAVSLVLD
jgi:hypothetical protein